MSRQSTFSRPKRPLQRKPPRKPRNSLRDDVLPEQQEEWDQILQAQEDEKDNDVRDVTTHPHPIPITISGPRGMSGPMMPPPGSHFLPPPGAFPGPPPGAGNVPPEIADMHRKISMVYGYVKVLDKKLTELTRLVKGLKEDEEEQEEQEQEEQEQEQEEQEQEEEPTSPLLNKY